MSTFYIPFRNFISISINFFLLLVINTELGYNILLVLSFRSVNVYAFVLQVILLCFVCVCCNIVDLGNNIKCSTEKEQ